MAKTVYPEIEASSVVSTAREYIGTPWHHAGRLKGVGIDCAGLLVCVSRDLGVPVEDDITYTDADEYLRMLSHIRKYCRKIPDNQALKAGDILVFRSRQMYNHCGFYAGENPYGTLIHAYNGGAIKQVVEHALDKSWLDRVAGVYRYKGIKA